MQTRRSLRPPRPRTLPYHRGVSTRRRFPESVFGVGDEPDPRFSLANERTFLAWCRTALALIAGGVALEALGLDLHPGLRLAASLILAFAGVVLPAFAWFEWARTERALRLGERLPGAASGALLAVVVTIVGVLIVLGILVR